MFDHAFRGAQTLRPGRARFAPWPLLGAAIAAVLAVTTTACVDEDSQGVARSAQAATAHAGAHEADSASVGPLLAAARRETARFHRLDLAEAAGWSMAVPRCRDNQPTGGMGLHYANPALLDDSVEVEKPEVLVYEPQQDGSMRLVAVEYVVPYGARPADAAPPTLFGQEFLRNDGDGLWMLHVWVWRDNPDGMFATWNPAVSCAHAA